MRPVGQGQGPTSTWGVVRFSASENGSGLARAGQSGEGGKLFELDSGTPVFAWRNGGRCR